MTRSFDPPLNHLLQDATLIHLRALGELFWYERETTRPGPVPEVSRRHPDLRASFYCTSLPWDPDPFLHQSNLLTALDKCVAHISIARDTSDPDLRVGHPWHGPYHLHGTTKLILQTWHGFQGALRHDWVPIFTSKLAATAQEHRLTIAGIENALTRIISEKIECGDDWRLDALP